MIHQEHRTNCPLHQTPCPALDCQILLDLQVWTNAYLNGYIGMAVGPWKLVVELFANRAGSLPSR